MNGLDGRNVSITLVRNTYKKIQYARGDDVMEEAGKTARVLSIYNRLILGELINKANEAEQFGVNEKSIQRDIEEIILCFLNTIFTWQHLLKTRR